PMKRMTPLAVAVGAVPGALPVLIGAVAFDGKITSLALMLFNIQFLWQFVHFWAIAWLADEDYKNAGFYLLPSRNGEKDKTTGLMSMIFGVLLIASSVTGYYMGYTGLLASLFLVVLNGYWTFNCWKLYQECSREAARRQMFTSFAHLPLTLLAFLVG
ncbi:MAG: UbiA family prenyltransferase, partial [Saprospiraceae bacterium]